MGKLETTKLLREKNIYEMMSSKSIRTYKKQEILLKAKKQIDKLHRLYRQDMLRILRLKDIEYPTPHCDINQWHKHMNVQGMWQTYYLE